MWVLSTKPFYELTGTDRQTNLGIGRHAPPKMNDYKDCIWYYGEKLRKVKNRLFIVVVGRVIVWRRMLQKMTQKTATVTSIPEGHLLVVDLQLLWVYYKYIVKIIK